jgi:hypothetical protein
MTWLPKLGDLLPQEPDREDAARRFEDAGFDLQQTLETGNKNSETPQPQSQGPHMETNSPQNVVIPEHLQKQIEKLRAEGATVGVPLFVQFDDKTLATLAASASKPVPPPTAGEELARFSAKAGIATLFAAGGALLVWFVTKPAEPAM